VDITINIHVDITINIQDKDSSIDKNYQYINDKKEEKKVIDDTDRTTQNTPQNPGYDDIYTHIENVRQLSVFDEERKIFEKKIINLKNIVDNQSKSVSDLRVLTETLRRGMYL
jgi:hypothetical protein